MAPLAGASVLTLTISLLSTPDVRLKSHPIYISLNVSAPLSLWRFTSCDWVTVRSPPLSCRGDARPGSVPPSFLHADLLQDRINLGPSNRLWTAPDPTRLPPHTDN